MVLTNSMLWEIKHYYSHEFQIGQEAIAIIRRYTGIEMPVDEAGFIAMHILNSELDIDMDLSRLITRIIQDVLNIITYHFHIVIDEESLDYERFVTHLKFFIQRAIRENESEDLGSTVDMIGPVSGVLRLRQQGGGLHPEDHALPGVGGGDDLSDRPYPEAADFLPTDRRRRVKRWKRLRQAEREFSSAWGCEKSMAKNKEGPWSKKQPRVLLFLLKN